jgi:4-amino-4-deoxy-L-arabinose transferase
MRLNEVRDGDRVWVVLAFFLAGIMFVFPLTVSFPLLDPDEGLHASIAQAMVEGGNWTTPQFLGQPFLDKPILYFWVQAASLSWFGESEMAVRLPGLFFGLLGAVTTALLARRLFSRRVGLLAGILYATTILPTALAQAASHDVALIPWINLVILLLWELDHAVSWRTTIACVVGAGFFLGLAILTKGLFGVAVVGVAFGGYLLLAWRLTWSTVLQGTFVVVLALLVASPWYLAVERQNPGYLQYFLFDRHWLGLTTDSQPHGDQPWWYYLPILLGGGLPWIGYLPVAIREYFAPTEHKSSGFEASATLLWFWLIGWTLLMLLAGSKLATYLWPVFPPMAVLVADVWARLLQGKLSATSHRLMARTFLSSSWSGPVVLPAAVLAVQVVYDVRFSWCVWTVILTVALIAPLPALAWRAGRWTASLVMATFSVAIQFVAIITFVLPPVAETASARRLAEHFNRIGQLPPRMVVAEGRIGSLLFYLEPSLRHGLRTAQFQQCAAYELPPLRKGDVIAVPEWKVPKLRPYFDVDHHSYDRVAPYRLYKVTSSLATPAED